jgi:hypothetical protein
MSRTFLAGIFLVLSLPLLPGAPAVAGEGVSPDRIFPRGRNGPIELNLIIDGSSRLEDTGARDWICEDLLEGLLREGDYLRIWIAGEEARIIFQGPLADNREALKELIRKSPPGSAPASASADFAGALGAALRALRAGREAIPGERPSIMTCTLLVSSSRSLSPDHIGGALPHLRYSRVLEFSGWRALVIALDIGPEVREAADSFLSNR